MADFLTAFKVTSQLENGWTVDNGGETYAGIAFKNWKDDLFAKAIYNIVKPLNLKKEEVVKNNPNLQKLIAAFFKKNYWDKIKGDLIENQLLANLVYDFYVNSNSAIIIINRAVGGREVDYINETTLKNFNERPGFCYDAIRRARKAHYDRLAKKPGLKKYHAGWLARLSKFPNKLTTA